MGRLYKLFVKYRLGERVLEFLIDVFGITAPMKSIFCKTAVAPFTNMV